MLVADPWVVLSFSRGTSYGFLIGQNQITAAKRYCERVMLGAASCIPSDVM